jgi:hypothetical protein
MISMVFYPMSPRNLFFVAVSYMEAAIYHAKLQYFHLCRIDSTDSTVASRLSTSIAPLNNFEPDSDKANQHMESLHLTSEHPCLPILPNFEAAAGWGTISEEDSSGKVQMDALDSVLEREVQKDI